MKPLPLLESVKISINENEYITPQLKEKIKKQVQDHWDVEQSPDPVKNGQVVANHLNQLYQAKKDYEKFKGNYEKQGEAYKQKNEINLYTNQQHINYLESALKKIEKKAGKEFPVKRDEKEDNDDMPF